MTGCAFAAVSALHHADESFTGLNGYGEHLGLLGHETGVLAASYLVCRMLMYCKCFLNYIMPVITPYVVLTRFKDVKIIQTCL